MSFFSSFGNYLFGVPEPSSAPYTADANAAQAAAQQYAGREQSGYDSEAQLADSLWNTVNGVGPSAADLQLQQSFGQNLRSGLAAGAGASGADSVLARYLASQATGQNGAALAQSAALLRANEINNAQARLGQVTGNMENASAGLYGANLSNGLGYSNLANNVDQANAQRAQQSEAAGLQFLSGVGSMYFGRPPSMGAGAGAGGGTIGYANTGGQTFNGSPSAYGAAYSAARPGYAASQYAGG